MTLYISNYQKKKDSLMSKLKSASLSSDCEKEILGTFKQNDNDTIFNILERLNSMVKVGLQSLSLGTMIYLMLRTMLKSS